MNKQSKNHHWSLTGDPEKPRGWLIPMAILVASSVFIVDMKVQLGVAGGTPYVALIFLAYWFHDKRTIWIFAFLSS